jgi:hypothetical protein
MVKPIHAHLDATRHRSSVVEYRLEQHLEQLGDRARRLGLETGKDTGRGAGVKSGTRTDTEVREGDDVPEWARRDSNARPLAPERRPGRQSPPAGADSPSEPSPDR